VIRHALADVRRIGLIVCALGSGGAAAAQALDTLDQRLWLRVGAFHPRIDTSARVDTADGTVVGTDLNFEGLGLARRKTLPTMLLGARLGSSWRAEFEVFRLSRSGSATLDAQIVVEDTTYPATARIDTRFVSDIYRLSGGYSFVHSARVELGAVFGLHVTRFDLGLDGIGSVAGQPAARSTEQRRQTVPLPTLGLYGALAFAPKWQATGRADYFSLSHGGYDGRLINAQANLLYRLVPQVALGLGWRFDDYRVEADRSAFSGRVDYRFQGPQAIVEASF